MTDRPYTVRTAAATDIGKRRRNEDAMLVGHWCSKISEPDLQPTTISISKPLLLAVADGMGGHVAGDLASNYITQQLSLINWSDNYQQELAETLDRIQEELFTQGQTRPDLKGMGSTIAGVVLQGSSLLHFNVGDSRVYQICGPSISQLSTDDTLFASHVITQALGGRMKPKSLDYHLNTVSIAAGDIILICSDGLSNLVRDMELLELAAQPPGKAVKAMIDLALERGGHDNISVIIASFA